MSVYDKEKINDLYDDPEIKKPERSSYEPEEISRLENENFTDKSGKSVNDTLKDERNAVESANKNPLFKDDVIKNSRANGKKSQKRKKIAIGLGIFSVLGIGAVFGISTFLLPAIQIAHIKEVFRGAYGGAQESTLGNRRTRIYNRAFFFRDDGEFDGYRQKGLFGFVKNRSSTKLIQDLEGKGFRVTPDLTDDGRWTGRFSSIEYRGTTITGSNSSIWERRSALKTVLSEEYPTRGYVWRSFQARKVYSRYGLNRTDWWSDNALTRRIADAEVRFRSKFITAIKRSSPAGVDVKAPTSGTDENGDPIDPDKDAADAQTKADVESELKSNIDDLSKIDPSSPNPISEIIEPDDIAKAAGGAVKGTVLNSIKVTSSTEAACTVIKTLNQIEVGSRTIKRLQLMKAFSLYMSMIDAARTGTVNSKDVGALMNLMTSKDPKTGKTAYQSGGWMWASKGSGKEPKYGNTYNTGAGTTGKLRDLKTTAYGFLGGAGNVEGTCDTVSNGWFQLGSAIVGIALAIPSFGGSIVANVGITATIEVLKSFVLSFATPLLTNLAAGTMVNGWEKGERFGDMLSSASGSAYYAQGSQVGMRPLKKRERRALMDDYYKMLDDELSRKPFVAKIFDASNSRSVLSRFAINFPKSFSDFASTATNPTKLFGSRAQAEDEGYECNDEDIVANDIATDPFCNPILGETQLDGIDPIDNMKWMLDTAKQVDDNGAPLPGSEYEGYVKKCFENQNIETLFQSKDFTSGYDDTCVSNGPDNKYLKFRAYRIDHGLIGCIDQELDKGHCDVVD